MSTIASRKHLTQFIGALLALPILYVAASGPLLRVNLGHPGRPYLEAMYKPLDCATASTGMNSTWRKYLELWGGYFELQVFDMVRITKP